MTGLSHTCHLECGLFMVKLFFLEDDVLKCVLSISSAIHQMGHERELSLNQNVKYLNYGYLCSEAQIPDVIVSIMYSI